MQGPLLAQLRLPFHPLCSDSGFQCFSEFFSALIAAVVASPRSQLRAVSCSLSALLLGAEIDQSNLQKWLELNDVMKVGVAFLIFVAEGLFWSGLRRVLHRLDVAIPGCRC